MDDTKQCPYCFEDIKATAQKCRYCEEYLSDDLRRENLRPSGSDSMLLPVGRPLPAIVAGYLGLVSVLPLLGILSIVFSMIALSQSKKNPEMLGRGRAIFGLAMGIIFTLFWSGLLLVPAFLEK